MLQYGCLLKITVGDLHIKYDSDANKTGPSNVVD